jgi:transposase
MNTDLNQCPTCESFRLGHLGLAAEMAREIGLVAVVDEMLGVDKQEVLTDGQATLAMTINALGYTSRPLYISPQFFELTHVPFLLGKPNNSSVLEIKPEHLNEHKLGRTLDQIAAFGPDAFFLKVASTAFHRLGIKVPQLHLDTTIHQLYGQYEDSDGNPLVGKLGTASESPLEPSQVIITRGFCKDGRPELKQFVQELLVSSDGDVPLMLKIHNGNSADVVIMKERMQKLKEELKKVGAQDLFPRIMVADAKFYSKDSLEAAKKDGCFWVTRVPNGIIEVKDVVEKANLGRGLWKNPSKQGWNTATTKGLRFQEFTTEKYGIEQSYIVIRTDASESRAKKSVDRDVQREERHIQFALKKLAKETFSCEDDVLKACAAIFENTSYHKLLSTKIETEIQHETQGRPRLDAKGKALLRLSEWSFIVNKESIAHTIAERRCFVIATNACEDEIPTDEVLNVYMKDQHGVESAFRFLKDPSYFADAFFLKNPSRISALICIMTLSLLLYSLLQRKIRMTLETKEETLPNQKKKPTSRPTLRWINQCFEGVDVVRVMFNGKITYQFQRMNAFVRKTLSLLGENYEKRYSEAYM